MDALSQTRRAMERTLLIAVTVEALFGRVIVKGLEKKPQLVRGIPEKLVPPPWFVALDYVALFLLYFVTVAGVLTLVVGRLEARSRSVEGGVGGIAQLAIGGMCTLVLAASVAGGATNHGGPPWLVLGALVGLAGFVAASTWGAALLRRGPSLTLAAGVTLVAVPVIAWATIALLTRRLWTEAEIFDGEARASFQSLTRLALVVAALLSPYLLAPRPFTRTILRVVPLVVALVVASVGAVMLRLDYLATISAINRALGLDLEPRAASQFIAFYLLAFATLAWTITACLTAATPARRRLGVGLALVVAAGLGFPWPMNFAVAAVGLLAMADAALDAEREERTGWAPTTPAIDDEHWHGFVGQLVTTLRDGGGDASAVSVRGEHGQIATVVLTERGGVPVRLCINRIAGSVVSLDLICGRESARPPAWSVVARRPPGHPEAPGAGPAIAVDDPGFDLDFRCRGDRAALMAALDHPTRAALRDGLEGWLAGWPGESVRHRVYPGHGAAIDHLLPLSTLAARRKAPAAELVPLLDRLGLCVTIVARLGVGAEPVTLAGSSATLEAADAPVVPEGGAA